MESRKRKRTAHIQTSNRKAEDEEDKDLQITNHSIPELPTHIIIAILSRLPIKSIFNCRRVCKEWRNLFSDPHFSKLRDATSRLSLLFDPSRIGRKAEERHYLLVELENLKTQSPDALIKLTTKNNLLDGMYPVLNSCNGLICLGKHASGEPDYICNPIFGEYITIPKYRRYDIKCDNVFGFGFNPGTNEYKVLRTLRRLIRHPSTGLHSYNDHWEAEVYTLGTGYWRSIGNVPYSIGSSSFFVSGALHWDVYDCNSSDFIRSFDFKSEQFRAVSPPPHFGPDQKAKIYRIRLGVLGGCLSICDATFSDHFDIWVMTDYGIKESWTKQLVIGNFNREISPSAIYEPILILNSGEILMSYKCYSFVFYDPKVKGFGYLNNCRIQSLFNAITLVPSFVSLKDVAKGENIKVCRP